MKVTILCVGKLKEKYLKMGIEEYSKRLKSYCTFQVIEVADEKAPEQLSFAEMQAVKAKEGDRLLAKIKETTYVTALTLDGTAHSSESLADLIQQKALNGSSDFAFVIGGSLGLSDKVLARANGTLNFGKMTYPHQLMRLILTEQLYRSFKINKNEPYHK